MNQDSMQPNVIQEVVSIIGKWVRQSEQQSGIVRQRLADLRRARTRGNLREVLIERSLGNFLPEAADLSSWEHKQVAAITLLAPMHATIALRQMRRKNSGEKSDTKKDMETTVNPCRFAIALSMATQGKTPTLKRESVERRFLQLLKTDQERVMARLGPLLEMLFEGNRELDLDWIGLYRDLACWDLHRYSARADSPRNRWARDFFRSFKGDNDDNSSNN